jgi:polysaccharide biosynthesis protein PslH
MRILFVTQVLPWPLDAGPKVRAHYVIRYLAEAGHDVHLLSFARPSDPSDAPAALRRMCAAVHGVPIVRSRARNIRDGLKSIWTGTPFLVTRDHLPSMSEAIADTLASASFDVLHLDQLWMAPYGMASRCVPHRVLDQHNAVFLVPQRLAAVERNPLVRRVLRHEASRLHAFERNACSTFDTVSWVTAEDRRAVDQTYERQADRYPVIPIAVDPTAQQCLRRTSPYRVTFLGGLHWPPNSEGIDWFLQHVWPTVVSRTPSAVLTIIGKGGAEAAPRWRRSSSIEVTGYVADPTRYLAETAVFIAPLRSGAGMRVKILDAWCWGLPVVSTTIGAEGLQAIDGENLLIADQPAAFAAAVLRLLQHTQLASGIAARGRETVESLYDWRTVYRAWDDVYVRPSVRRQGEASLTAAGEGSASARAATVARR